MMKGARFYPPLYFDEFWMTRKDVLDLNTTNATLPLTINYSPIQLIKFQMQLQMELQWKQQEAMGVTAVGDTDEFKRILTDTNPYLLGITAVVSVLHMLFDFLAFKNDIQFWRQNRSMQGMCSKPQR